MSQSINPDALEVLVGSGLALWTFGQMAFLHSDASSLRWVVDDNPLAFVNAVVAGVLIAAVAGKGLDLKLAGAVGLVCLLLSALVV